MSLKSKLESDKNTKNYNLDYFFFLSSSLMCVLDKNGFVVKANPSFCNLLNLTEEDLSGVMLSSIVHPEDRLRFCSFIEQTSILNSQNTECEARIRYDMGSYSWVTWTSSAVMRDNLVYLIGHDITQTKNNISKITENSNILLKIIDLVPHPIFVKNDHGTYILANEAQVGIFSSTKKDFIGRTDAHFVKKGAELTLINETDKAVINNREAVEITEQCITHLDGKQRVMITHKIPFISDIDGKVNILGISIDITDRKKAEEDLLRANFELDSFVYKSSHDLRAPLRSVLGLIQVAEKHKDEATRLYTIELIKSSILRLDNFIGDLTNYSRNNRLEIVKEDVDFEVFTEEMLENLRYMQGMDQVKVEVNVSGTGAFTLDKKRLEIIFSNLISNAIKYRNINIDNSYLTIDIKKQEDIYEIKFSDNGIGIPAEYMDRIFEMFFRASEQSFGSGLGLYIVKQVVEKMNGKITIESEAGVGTTFNISIPA